MQELVPAHPPMFQHLDVSRLTASAGAVERMQTHTTVRVLMLENIVFTVIVPTDLIHEISLLLFQEKNCFFPVTSLPPIF